MIAKFPVDAPIRKVIKALGNLGLAHLKLGNIDRAIDCCEECAILAREMNNRGAEKEKRL